MFHPPAPPPHYLPAPPPHHAPVHHAPMQHSPIHHPPVQPRHYLTTPIQSSPNPSPHHAYPSSPYTTAPRPYHPPPSHRFLQAGPSHQTQYPNPLPPSRLPPAPHSAPARMDNMASWLHENPGPGDFSFAFDQPSPTPRAGQPNPSSLPRASMMSASQSGASINNYQSPEDSTPASTTLVVHPWGPREGWAGATILVKADVNVSAILAKCTTPDLLTLVIGDYVLETNHRIIRGGRCQFLGGHIRVMTAEIPECGDGFQYQASQVYPVSIQVLDGQNRTLESIHIGDWTFNPDAMLPPRSANKREGEQLDAGRQRWNDDRRSVSAAVATMPCMPGLSTLPVHPATQAAIMAGTTARLPSVLQPVPLQPAHQMGGQNMYSSGLSSWANNPFGSQGPLFAGFNPQGPPGSMYNHHAHFGARIGQVALAPCPQPQLMRSTQIPASAMNSYYDAPKAEAIIAGDMGLMAKGWTEDEWDLGRRLVKVWRRQQGPAILVAYEPMSHAEWVMEKDCVVVSCIFRAERDSCWITSVDILYLLEAIIGTRFSVEEKNRIRRNLEGFRPQTIAKTKAPEPEPKPFFRTIMDFPQPRPRNIEKDVKVFPWECVAQALKKIVAKYTATVLEDGQQILWQPPSGENATVPLPNVRDEYTGPRTVTYDQSSVYTPPIVQNTLPSVSQVQVPIDPSLLEIPGHDNGMSMVYHNGPMQAGPGSMHPNGTVSEYGVPSSAMPIHMNPLPGNWQQSNNGGYRNFDSPPDLSYSHSSDNTTLDFPVSPRSFYNQQHAGGQSMGAPHMTTSTTQSGLNADTRAATPQNAQHLVSVQPSPETNGHHQDALGFWHQPYKMDGPAAGPYSHQPSSSSGPGAGPGLSSGAYASH